jgi:protein TonB
MQRDGPRHFTAYTITAILYIMGALGIYFYQTKQMVAEKKPEEKVLQMSLSTFVPEPIKKVLEKVEKPKTIEEPEPIVEELQPIVKKILPKALSPIVKKIIPKKRVIKKVIKPKKKKVRKKITKKKKSRTRKKHKKSVKKAKTSSRAIANKSLKSKPSPAKKSAFFAKVRAQINRYKMYPRIAQKRAMEGSVKVKFTILANGHVSHIQVSGRKVFLNSAREAVRKAFPIPVKSIPISLPKTVNLTLHYQLR